MVAPVVTQILSLTDSFSMIDLLGVIITTLSIALPILLFLMKSFSDQIAPERVFEQETGSEAWKIAMVDAEEGITMIRILQQGIMILVFAILYILVSILVSALEISLPAMFLLLFNISTSVAIGLIALLLMVIVITYLSINQYRAQKRKYEIIAKQQKKRNHRLVDFSDIDRSDSKEKGAAYNEEHDPELERDTR